jgi:glycerol-3-phosphate acyltransferase PlsY
LIKIIIIFTLKILGDYFLLNFILLLIISYILGAIPFGFIIGKITKKIDLREYGSKNVGFTNAFRCLGWKIGIIVLILDILKGFLPSYFFPSCINFSSSFLNNPKNSGLIFGLMTIIGHMFTIFLNFKGGKGVATSIGVFLALSPIPLLITFCLSISLVFITKFVSLGSISGAILLPFLIKILQPNDNLIFIVCIILSIFILYKHKENLKRLLKGEELPLKQIKINKE